MFSFFHQWLKPSICFRKYYVMEKLEQLPCKCKVSCKYPPPTQYSPVRIPNKNNTDLHFKYLSKN